MQCMAVVQYIQRYNHYNHVLIVILSSNLATNQNTEVVKMNK